MDEDAIYKRVDIPKLAATIGASYPDNNDTYATARAMVVELNRKVEQMVLEFENGDGEFSFCYFQVQSTK